MRSNIHHIVILVRRRKQVNSGYAVSERYSGEIPRSEVWMVRFHFDQRTGHGAAIDEAARDENT